MNKAAILVVAGFLLIGCSVDTAPPRLMTVRPNPEAAAKLVLAIEASDKAQKDQTKLGNDREGTDKGKQNKDEKGGGRQGDGDRSANPKYPGNDATKAPPGTEWRGQPGSTPGDGNGSYYNPKTGESFHPDLNHPDPVGPHWDYVAPDGTQYRIMPDGTLVPKP